MEAGGLELTEESQDVYRGDQHRPRLFRPRHLAAALLRRHLEPLGGLVPRARPLDFTPKPFTRSAAGRSAGSISTPTAPTPTPSSTSPPRPRRRTCRSARRDYDFRRFQFRWSPPTRFAEKYGPEIEASTDIRLFLNANLVDLRLRRPRPVDRRRSSAATPPPTPASPSRPAPTPLHRRHRERPAAAQLHQPDPEGIGNRTDMVGRCFCDHPHFVLADVVCRAADRDANSTRRSRASMRSTEA